MPPSSTASSRRWRKATAQALNIVLKADVHGSVEALKEALSGQSTEEVTVKIVASSVGGINESDANLAFASNAILVGFNVRADSVAKRVIEEKSLDLHYYSVIYDVIDDVKKAIGGMLGPEIREQIIGLAQVRDVFRSHKFGAVAGCMVLEGVIKPQQPDPRAARQRRGLRGQAGVAAPLQGRRRRGAVRHRVRRRGQELQRRAGRRPDRGVRAGRGGTER